MKNIIQNGFLILVLGIGLIYPNHFVLAFLTALAVVINLYFFIKDKRELAHAIFYVRPKKQITFLGKLWQLLIAIIIVFGIYYFFNSIPKEMKKTIDVAIGFYLPIIMISIIPVNYYQHFKTSVRSFNSGIRLPKNQNAIINWELISKIEMNENTLILVFTDQEEFIFEFDERDIDDVINIKNQFEQRSIGIS